MNAKTSLVLILIATGFISSWLLRPVSPWAEVTQPAPVPAVPKAAQPRLVQAIQLPPLAGYGSPKPVVAADPEGNVLIVAYGTTNVPFSSDTLLWQSHDHGETWSAPVNLTNQAQDGEVFFDPWLETDRRGRFYFVHVLRSDGRPFVRRSRDAGRNWSSALPINWRWADRPVMGISPNGQRLAVAASLAERTDNFATEPLDSNDPNLAQKIRESIHHSAGVFVSEDQGESWNKVKAPFDNKHAIPFSIVCKDDGRLAVSWIVGDNGSRSVVTVSNSSRSSWTKTTLVEALQPDRPHAFNGARFPVLALDGQSGLHVAYVTAGATALMVRQSPDGHVWEEAKSLSNETVDEVRMAAIDACGAMVHVTWMERSGMNWQAFYRGSQDYGQTWSPALCLSQAITLTDGTITNGFQITSDDDQSSVRDDGTGRAHCAWSISGGRVVHALLDWSVQPRKEKASQTTISTDP